MLSTRHCIKLICDYDDDILLRLPDTEHDLLLVFNVASKIMIIVRIESVSYRSWKSVLF